MGSEVKQGPTELTEEEKQAIQEVWENNFAAVAKDFIIGSEEKEVALKKWVQRNPAAKKLLK